MRVMIACIMLAGCTTGAVIPGQNDYVALSRIDQHGLKADDAIYDNDVLRTVLMARRSQSVMPAGSYFQARAVVDAAIMREPPLGCEADPQSGTIIVYSRHAPDFLKLTACNVVGFATIRAALEDLLPPWQPPTAAEIAAR